MSLDLYREEIDNRLASLRPATEPEPGMFDNFLVGTGKVAMQTFAKAGRAASMAAAPLSMALEKAPGSTEVQDRFFKAHDDIFGNAVDYWTPKPGEVGAAGQVVGQLLGTLPLVLANPSAAVATTQLATGEDLVRKGVDAGTAQAVGGVQAAGLGLGIWVPILGQTLAQRVLLGGAGFNVAQGLATRAASAKILEGTPGAEDFKALDPTALTLDVLLGAAFGGIAHINPRMRAEGDAWHTRLKEWGAKLKPSEVDALATLRQAQHLNADSLPGKPVDVEDVNAHVARMRQAIDDLANDRPVNVEDMPAGRFEADPEREDATIESMDGILYDSMHEAYDGSADTLARHLEGMGFDVRRESSRVSMSEYLYAKTPDYLESETGDVLRGRELKFRLSNHTLPGHYDQAHFDVSVLRNDNMRPDVGGDITEALRYAAKKSGIEPVGEAKALIDARVAREEAIAKSEADLKTAAENARQSTLSLAHEFVSRQPEGTIIGVSKRGRMTATLDGKIIETLDTFPRVWASGTQAAKGQAPKMAKADALVFLEGNGAATAAEQSALKAQSVEPETPTIADPIYRQAIETMANETGWAEQGGRIIRGQDGQVTGRTSWVPNAEWWPGRPKGLTEAKAKEAIAKALAGESLKPAEQRLIDYMLGYAKERVAPALRRMEALDEAVRAAIANDLMVDGLDGHVRDIADADTVARAAEIDEGALEKAAIMYQNDDAAFIREAERIVGEHASRQPNQGAAPDGRSQAHQSAARTAEARPETSTEAAGLDPLASEAARFAAEHPDLPIVVGKNADGSDITTTPRQWLEDADATMRQAQDDVRLFEIAAGCLLGGGR